MRCCPQKLKTRVFSDELPKDLKHTEYGYFAQDRFALSLPAYKAGVLSYYDVLRLFC